MAEWLPILNAVGLTAIASFLSFVVSWWFYRVRKHDDARAVLATAEDKRDLRISELETQLKLVGASILPISAAFQAILIKELTHYHTPEMDELMTRVGPPSTLSPEETARLSQLLEERTRDMASEITDSERDAAQMLPMVMRRATAEMNAIPAGEIQSVFLPAGTEEGAPEAK